MNFGIVYGTILIIFFAIGLLIGKTKVNVFLYLSDLVISIPAYFFIKPANGMFFDTVRFEALLNQIRSVDNLSGILGGLSWTFSFSEYASQPLVSFYIWFFSLFHNNGVLFFFTTMLFLLFLSNLLLDIKKYYGISGKTIIIIQFVILMSFNLFYQIEGIRNFLSFMIFTWAIFNDFTTEKKSRKLFVLISYLFCIFFHPIVIIFILLRVVVYIRSHIAFFKNYFFDIVISMFLISYNYLISFIISFLSNFSGISFVNNLLFKSQYYIHGQSSFNTYSSDKEMIVSSLMLLLLVSELILYLCFKKNINKNYLRIYIYIIFFTIGSFLNVQIYLRSIMLVLFMSIPIKSLLFSEVSLTRNQIYLQIIYKLITYSASITFFVFWYGYVYRNVLSY